MSATGPPVSVMVVPRVDVNSCSSVDKGCDMGAWEFLGLLTKLWVSVETLETVLITGAMLLVPVGLSVVDERVKPIGQGVEVPNTSFGRDGLLRL